MTNGETDRFSPCSCVLGNYTLYIGILCMIILWVCFAPHSPGNANTESFQNTWASTWVKMATSWVCFAVYLWTLLAPLVLGTCRDFGYDE